MRTRGAARSESTTVSPEDTTTTTRLRKRSATGSAQVEKIQAPRQYLDSLLRNHVDPPYAPALDLFQKPQPEQVAGYTLAAMDAVRNGTWTPAVGRADAANKFGVTVLHKACRAQSLASVEQLLDGREGLGAAGLVEHGHAELVRRVGPPDRGRPRPVAHRVHRRERVARDLLRLRLLEEVQGRRVGRVDVVAQEAVEVLPRRLDLLHLGAAGGRPLAEARGGRGVLRRHGGGLAARGAAGPHLSLIHI